MLACLLRIMYPFLTHHLNFIYIIQTTIENFFLRNISFMHISDSIKFFISKSSLKIDGIKFVLIKILRLEMCILLAHIFSLSFANGIFPKKA